MLFGAAKLHLVIVEVPVHYQERFYGLICNVRRFETLVAEEKHAIWPKPERSSACMLQRTCDEYIRWLADPTKALYKNRYSDRPVRVDPASVLVTYRYREACSHLGCPYGFSNRQVLKKS